MLKFSWVKGGIKKVTPSADITIERAVDLIKGDTYKEPVERIRNAEDPSVKKVMKDGMDYFLFSGTFKKRLTDSLIKHSGLICIDLDPYRKSKAAEPELVNPRLLEEFDQVKADIIQDPFTLCCFVSPSGNGYKVVIKIDDKKHLESFHQIADHYKTNFNLFLDKGVNDVARACFASHDPGIYFNPNSETFSVSDEEVVSVLGLDPLFMQASSIVVMHGQGSTSLLQRKLKLGYNRAGRMIDQLAEAGILGPFDGTKAREVLIPDEYALDQYMQKMAAKESAKEVTPDVPLTDHEESEARAFSASEQLKLNKDYRRAVYVVEQAERENIDLTGDYSDWQLIAFSLALFGDKDGRALWHRISRVYGEYDEKETNEKFDNALKTGRFKNPAKFFSIAKDYGLDVKLPRTIEEAKKEKSVNDVIGEQSATDDYLQYGIWEEDGVYWGLAEKDNKKYMMSNFKMRILYHVQTSEEEAYRLIQIKNIFGLDRIVKMNTDDGVSVGAFKKVVARQGNFIWKGSDPDLCKLMDMLQRHERPTELVTQLGYHKRDNFYAWANGIYDCFENEFVPVDECGIVEHYKIDKAGVKAPHNYFIPALSKMFAEKDSLYVNDKRFLYIERDTEFKDWAKLFCEAYEEGKITLMWFVMCIFSDIIFKEMGDRFPMLFVFGQKGTGKGTMIESCMKLFGHGQKQLMLGGSSTVVGFMRKSGQYSNGAVWLDEFKNTIKEAMKESVKNLYDRIGYERGKKDNTFQTESTSVDSGIVVSGQEMPISEEALFTRFLLVTKLKPSGKESSKIAFRKLKDMEKAGLSCITVQLLQYRDYIKNNFRRFYEEEQKNLNNAIPDADVAERFINNYASIIAMHRILNEHEELPFNTVHFRELCKKTLLEQHYVLKGNDTIGKFWTIVESLFNQDMIKDGHHFILKNGYLYIRIQDIYQHYAEMMQKRRDPGVLDEATLRNYLEHDPKAFVKREKKFFGGAQKWCFIFKYVELGVDLIRANTQSELKAKYLEMGIDLSDEEGEPSIVIAPEVKTASKPQQIALKMKPQAIKTKEEPQSVNTTPDDDEPPF